MRAPGGSDSSSVLIAAMPEANVSAAAPPSSAAIAVAQAVVGRVAFALVFVAGDALAGGAVPEGGGEVDRRRHRAGLAHRLRRRRGWQGFRGASSSVLRIAEQAQFGEQRGQVAVMMRAQAGLARAFGVLVLVVDEEGIVRRCSRATRGSGGRCRDRAWPARTAPSRTRGPRTAGTAARRSPAGGRAAAGCCWSGSRPAIAPRCGAPAPASPGRRASPRGGPRCSRPATPVRRVGATSSSTWPCAS